MLTVRDSSNAAQQSASNKFALPYGITRTLLCSIQLKQPLHQREYQRLALLPACAALRPPCNTLVLQRFSKYARHLLRAAV